jgi:uncharacterized coiled-coil DUF342 family protein
MNETRKQMIEINKELQRLRTKRSQLLPKAKQPLDPWKDVDAKYLSKADEAELVEIDNKIKDLERKRQDLQAQCR